jgi:hypothetical protein
MDRKFLMSTVIVFVVSMIFGFVVHEVLLGANYSQVAHLYRAEEDQMNYLHWMLLGALLASAAMVWIYRQGKKDTPWLPQGVRFGVALVLLMTIPWFLTYYAVQPLPGMLVVKQIVFESVGTVVLGILVAWLHRTG